MTILNTTPTWGNVTTFVNTDTGVALEYVRGRTSDIQVITSLCDAVSWWELLTLSLIIILVVLRLFFRRAKKKFITDPHKALLINLIDLADELSMGVIVFYVVIKFLLVMSKFFF